MFTDHHPPFLIIPIMLSTQLIRSCEPSMNKLVPDGSQPRGHGNDGNPSEIRLNTLWPIDAIWRYRSGSILARVMACCLQDHLDQFWLLITELLWDSPESNFTVSVQASILYNELEIYTFESIAASPRGQWVKLTSRKIPFAHFENSHIARELYCRVLWKKMK